MIAEAVLVANVSRVWANSLFTTWCICLLRVSYTYTYLCFEPVKIGLEETQWWRRIWWSESEAIVWKVLRCHEQELEDRKNLKEGFNGIAKAINCKISPSVSRSRSRQKILNQGLRRLRWRWRMVLYEERYLFKCNILTVVQYFRNEQRRSEVDIKIVLVPLHYPPRFREEWLRVWTGRKCDSRRESVVMTKPKRHKQTGGTKVKFNISTFPIYVLYNRFCRMYHDT